MDWLSTWAPLAAWAALGLAVVDLVLLRRATRGGPAVDHAAVDEVRQQLDAVTRQVDQANRSLKAILADASRRALDRSVGIRL